MAAETTQTYTFTPPVQSVFSPENIKAKPVDLTPAQAKNPGQPIQIQQISTKKKS